MGGTIVTKRFLLGFWDTKRKEEHEIKNGYGIWYGKQWVSLNF